MSTRAHERAVAAGQTLIADVSGCAVPFGWAAVLPAGVTLDHDFSISEEPGDWLEPDTNASITETVHDTESVPLRFLRWRHTAGAGAAMIRIATSGRVAWSVS